MMHDFKDQTPENDSGKPAKMLEDSMSWRPVESAPKDGTPFLALQEGEIYLACFTTHPGWPPRLTFRTHGLFTQSRHRRIKARMDGEEVDALVAVDEPWTETFRHDWTYWTRGFEFKPTHWHPAPEPLK